MEENKTKNNIITTLAGNFSSNVNKLQSTDFSLKCPQNDIIANSEISMFSGEPAHQSTSSIAKEPIKLNEGDTKINQSSYVTVSTIVFKQSK